MNSVGRPLKFETVEELDKQIEEYFDSTPYSEWTWTGLALALDTDRWTLHNYVDRPEYSGSIKKAMLKVEQSYEHDLKKYGRSGTIFALKNFDWKDKNETDITSKGEKLETGSDVVKELANELNEIHRRTNQSGNGGDTDTMDSKVQNQE